VKTHVLHFEFVLLHGALLTATVLSIFCLFRFSVHRPLYLGKDRHIMAGGRERPLNTVINLPLPLKWRSSWIDEWLSVFEHYIFNFLYISALSSHDWPPHTTQLPVVLGRFYFVTSGISLAYYNVPFLFCFVPLYHLTKHFCRSVFCRIVSFDMWRRYVLYITTNIHRCALATGPYTVYPLRTVRPICRTGVPLPSRCCIIYIYFFFNKYVYRVF
jgi:hypothetical protein